MAAARFANSNSTVKYVDQQLFWRWFQKREEQIYTHQGMSIFSPKISKVEGLVGECLLFVRLCVNSIKVATFPSALENQ